MLFASVRMQRVAFQPLSNFAVLLIALFAVGCGGPSRQEDQAFQSFFKARLHLLSMLEELTPETIIEGELEKRLIAAADDVEAYKPAVERLSPDNYNVLIQRHKNICDEYSARALTFNEKVTDTSKVPDKTFAFFLVLGLKDD